MKRFGFLLALTLLVFGSVSQAASYGPQLEGFDYAYPVSKYKFESQKQKLEMSYIDVKPKTPNGRVVVLLHGKNFCAGTWKDTIDALSQVGFRVIAPDQIGFCKSMKPEAYQYTFQQLARNTRALLESLKIEKAIIMGHSTGGMLAVRYALMYAGLTEKVVLVNPIGLEDWKAKGVPSISVDDWYERELKTSAEKIRNYEKSTYYAGTWSERYEPWVQMLAGLNAGKGKKIVAWNSALIYDMIFTQPVFYEFQLIKVPTLLMIGLKDTTAIGKDLAPEDVKTKLGRYTELGKEASKLIPNSKLIEFASLGHAPQMQDPKAFHEALLKELSPAR